MRSLGNRTPTDFTAREAIGYMKEGFKKDLVELVIKDVTKELVDEFRERIEPMVRGQAERITLDAVQRFQDMAYLTEQMEIHLKWREGDEVHDTRFRDDN